MFGLGLCRPSCFIAIMFILGNVIFTFLMDRHHVVADYKESLDDTQKKVFDKIADERKKLAMQGYGLGIGISILGLIAMAFFKKTKTKSSFLSYAMSRICLITSITFVVQYFYYTLMPKSAWMLDFLNTDEQKKKWLNVYRTYQYNYHLGMVIGLVGAGLLGYAIKC